MYVQNECSMMLMFLDVLVQLLLTLCSVISVDLTMVISKLLTSHRKSRRFTYTQLALGSQHYVKTSCVIQKNCHVCNVCETNNFNYSMPLSFAYLSRSCTWGFSEKRLPHSI